MTEAVPATDSTHDRVVRSYFETTSSRTTADEQSIHRANLALGRLLGDWAPQRDEVVVDLGSGMGEGCAFALFKGARSATGVNMSTGENELARRLVPGASFVDADLVSYLRTAEAASVDRILALNILEHLDRDTLAIVLEHAARVLRPGGVLVAVTPNATSPFGAMTRYWDITHHLAFTPSSVRQIGVLCGFGQFDFRECGPRPHGLVSTVRFGLWQMIRLWIKFRLLVETASTKGGIYTADFIIRFSK